MNQNLLNVSPSEIISINVKKEITTLDEYSKYLLEIARNEETKTAVFGLKAFGQDKKVSYLIIFTDFDSENYPSVIFWEKYDPLFQFATIAKLLKEYDISLTSTVLEDLRKHTMYKFGAVDENGDVVISLGNSLQLKLPHQFSVNVDTDEMYRELLDNAQSMTCKVKDNMLLIPKPEVDAYVQNKCTCISLNEIYKRWKAKKLICTNNGEKRVECLKKLDGKNGKNTVCIAFPVELVKSS